MCKRCIDARRLLSLRQASGRRPVATMSGGCLPLELYMGIHALQQKR